MPASLNLPELRRKAEAAQTTGHWPDYSPSSFFDTYFALIDMAEECERLREIVAELNRRADEAYQHRPHGMVKEHAFLSNLASMIQRGDHRKEPSNG